MCRIICLTLAASCLLALGIFWSLSMFTTDGLPNAAVTGSLEPANVPVTNTAEQSQDDINIHGGSDTANVDIPSLVKGNNQFAFDLYDHLRKKEGNIIFSPFSISTALAMAYAGARGQTAEEMAKVLRFSLPQGRMHLAFGKLINDLQKDDKERPYNLYIANAGWGQKGFPLQADFLQLVENNYHGGFREVDFLFDREAARKIINHWVEKQTNKLIKELLGPSDLHSRTKLVLTNAIYFKASWEFPFSPERTKEERFEIEPGQFVKVPMMQILNGRFNYGVTEGIKAVELPYQGDRLAMVVLLPEARGQLAGLEKAFSAAKLRKVLSQLVTHEGAVAMPRFRFTFRWDVTPDLVTLGMETPFSGDADFSGISPQSIQVDRVIHQAFIDTDELGTEAAAVTALLFSEIDSDLRPFSFKIDQPFLFFIRDKVSGSILFQGRVVDPRIK